MSAVGDLALCAPSCLYCVACLILTKNKNNLSQSPRLNSSVLTAESMAEDVAFLLHFTDAEAWKRRSDKMVLVPELNLSQCLRMVCLPYLVDVQTEGT